MPSDVVGVGLQAHHYSDEKWILLITIYFLPLPPRLFSSFSHVRPAGFLATPKGREQQRPSLPRSFSHSFHFPRLYLPLLIFYAPDILSLLCPFLFFFHLPCGLLTDIPTEWLKGTDTFLMNTLILTCKQHFSLLITYLFKMQVQQQQHAKALAVLN